VSRGVRCRGLPGHLSLSSQRKALFINNMAVQIEIHLLPFALGAMAGAVLPKFPCIRSNVRRMAELYRDSDERSYLLAGLGECTIGLPSGATQPSSISVSVASSLKTKTATAESNGWAGPALALAVM
jgi:hypothetical protein